MSPEGFVLNRYGRPFLLPKRNGEKPRIDVIKNAGYFESLKNGRGGRAHCFYFCLDNCRKTPSTLLLKHMNYLKER